MNPRDKEGGRFGVHPLLYHPGMSGEMEKKMSLKLVDSLVMEVHQGIQGEGEDIIPTSMTLELRFRNLKAS